MAIHHVCTYVKCYSRISILSCHPNGFQRHNLFGHLKVFFLEKILLNTRQNLLEYIEIEDKATILDLQKMHTGVCVILGVRYLKRALQKFQDDRAAFSLTLRHNID